MTLISQPVLVIGGGNMGRAIVQGAVRAGTMRAERVVVLEPDSQKHAPFIALGCGVSLEPEESLRLLEAGERQHGLGAVLLAVKPQMLPEVGATLGPRLRAGARLHMSILAGTTTARLAETLGGRVVRLMPNTPSQVGKGLTAVCPGPGAKDEDLSLTRTLFESVGRVVDLPEDLLDAFTAVAGSGPAYLFYLAEAMGEGARAVGFSNRQALEIVHETIVGSAALLAGAPETSPGELRAMVTSKGGTTAAACGVLDDRGVGDAVRTAIVAARDRGRELGAG